MSLIYWSSLNDVVPLHYLVVYVVFGSLICAGRQRHALVELHKFVTGPPAPAIAAGKVANGSQNGAATARKHLHSD